MSTNPTTASTEADTGPGRLYPASISHLIEERPLIWYESPEQYDQLLRDIFGEMAPQGVLECIFVKNLVDYIWELRRMKKMKHTAINFAMPDAAGQVIAPGMDFFSDCEEAQVRRQAAAVALGVEKEAGGKEFAQRMQSKCVTPEMIHYKALNSEAEHFQWISRECERLEGRFHRLLKDFEGRRTTLAAMAKSLVEREKAEVVNFKEVN